MSKASHPYFIPNGDSREDTAVLLVGTADEAGIDQRAIQAVPGGFNITPEVARAAYGDAFVDDQPDPEEPAVDPSEKQPVGGDVVNGALTGQVPVSGNLDGTGDAMIQGKPEDGDVESYTTPDEDADEEPEEVVAPYDEWEYPTLKTEVANRGLDVEDQKKDTLVAALTQDDESDDSTTD